MSGTLSLNLMLTYFDDPTLLAHRGFTVVHFSRWVRLRARLRVRVRVRVRMGLGGVAPLHLLGGGGVCKCML